MKRPVLPSERGAALLAVLLLVAVTGAIAAAAMEKLRLSRAVAVNAAGLDVARGFAGGIEQLALVTIDDMTRRGEAKTTLAGGWNGAVRRVPLPGGGEAQIRVRDGGNCFNVNSVADGDPRTGLVRRPTGIAQFAGLMKAIGVPEPEARRIADAAADWVDSDSAGSAEDAFYAASAQPRRTGNTLFADVGELRSLAGMTPEYFARLRPWLCALPAAELSPLNVNTLLPEQAPLLAMLAPDQLDPNRARRLLEARSVSGWDNVIDFWRTDALRDLNVPLDAQVQPQVLTRWFVIDVKVAVASSQFTETALVDARVQPARLVARTWTDLP